MKKILVLSVALVGMLAACASSSVEESSSLVEESSSSVAVSSSSIEPSSSSEIPSSSSVEPSSSSVEVSSSQAQTNTATELFISEYIEGSVGSNKYIEIFNGTGAIVDLSTYALNLFSNGAATATATLAFSSFASTTLGIGECLVVYNTAQTYVTTIPTTNWYGYAYDAANPVVPLWNGDDAVALLKGGVIIDLIGIIGVDPGAEWTGTDANAAAASTKDKTLSRVPTLTSPNSTFTWNEWACTLDTVNTIGSYSY